MRSRLGAAKTRMSTGDKRVLITGASGFIGAACLSRLQAAGYAIDAVTSRPVPARASAGVNWHQYDLLDPDQCAVAVAAARPTHLLHLAWIATPGEFWSNAKNLAWLSGATALFEAFYRLGGKRAVGVGTCAEYAWSTTPYREDGTAAAPVTIYGQCKRAAALVLEAACSVHGGTAAWARLFFPYGPGEPEQRLLPYVIRAFLRREAASCTDGRQSRDFVFVDDVADALVALLDGTATGTYNIGSGRAITLRDVVGCIAEKLDGTSLIRYGARAAPAGDPPYVVADISKIMHATGWRPKVDIDHGIDASITYWKARETAAKGTG